MKLNEINKELNTRNSLSDNREKMNVSELYGSTFTVVAYEFVTSSKYNNESAIVILKEYPNHFHFSGSMETKLLELIDKDAEAKAEFEQNGVKVQYILAKNKNGQQFTKINVVSD